MTTRSPKAPPLSAYLCFAHATRLKLVEEAKAQARADGDGPGQGGSSFSSAIERQLGKAWKELGVEEKKQWESQALENRERYTEECRVAGVEPKAFPHALLLPNRPDRVYAAQQEEAAAGSATAAAAGGNYGAARAPVAPARRRPARPPDKEGVNYRWDAKSRSWVATGEAARPAAPEQSYEPPLAVAAVAEAAVADPSSFTS